MSIACVMFRSMGMNQQAAKDMLVGERTSSKVKNNDYNAPLVSEKMLSGENKRLNFCFQFRCRDELTVRGTP